MFQRANRNIWTGYISILTIIIFGQLNLSGQNNFCVSGVLKDQYSNQNIPYATVSLHQINDTTLITGSLSNAEGEFFINSDIQGIYFLIINFLGYKPIVITIDLSDKDCFDTGTILLEKESIQISEAIVTGNRITAKTGVGKTSFYINKKMYDVSSTGIDILKNIPGVSVDLMHNVSLEGNQNIVLLVDNKERDRNFISQLNASQIDRIEIIKVPGSKYDANVSGVINVILKKNTAGINGHIYAEIPTLRSEMFLFPSYSLNLSHKKLNLFTSYNGDFRYFNIVENRKRRFDENSGSTSITSKYFIRQRNWSHRFHYGFDYFLNNRNQFNFYGFFNPYSNEDNGNIVMMKHSSDYDGEYWSARMEDKDQNHAHYYSLYYKHNFHEAGNELSVELAYYNFKAENTTIYSQNMLEGHPADDRINSVRPKQNMIRFKLDFSSQITRIFKFETGIKAETNLKKDRLSDEFEYSEDIFAGYSSLQYGLSKLNITLGLRTELTAAQYSQTYNNHYIAVLPNTTIAYEINPKHKLRISYKRMVRRPNLYNLNPYTSIYDPYTISSGNKDLNPQFRNNFSIEYSISPENNYLSAGFFYNSVNNILNTLTHLNDTGILETRMHNMGMIEYYGLQITGAIKLNKSVNFNTYCKLYRTHTLPNIFAKQHYITNKHKLVFESGAAAIVSLKYNISASFQMRYHTSNYNLQDKSFNDIIYFISIDKTFNKNLNIGILSTLILAKTYTYDGLENEGNNFYNYYEGNLQLSNFPFWIKIRYQFSSGKSIKTIEHDREIIDNNVDHGF